jgi:hypothetical protein
MSYRLRSSDSYKTYATSTVIAADINILTDFGGKFAARALYVGSGGNVVLTLPDANDTNITLYNIPDGTFLPISFKAVIAIGTTIQKFTVMK